MISRRTVREDSISARLAWRGSVAAFVATVLGSASARAADLPVPCIAGSCGAAAASFVTSGNATAVSSGNTMRIDQRSDKAILNWSSFDVAPGNSVVFNQPGASSVALNRIHQASPSQIFGALEANGQIYLVNQNGIVFGATSRVRTAGLIASTLNISDQNFSAGLLASDLLEHQRPALESDGRTSVVDADGNKVLGPDGKPLEIKLSVQQGAELTTRDAGQRILLAGQKVENSGKITTPEGQAVLAAGEKVYLQASDDPNLRGLVVEVDKGGTAWNRLTGEVSAAQGNVTLVGLTVNQDGRLSATTTVSANGSVRLLARDTVTFGGSQGKIKIGAQNGGTLTVGSGSSVSVLPDLTDTATAVDDQPQALSKVELSGKQIFVESNASIVAPGGQVSIAAQTVPNSAGAYDADARIRIHSGAFIDVSGTRATAPVTRNLVTVELRANELRDSPLQRDGALRGQPVVVDARVGTPLADVSGAIKTIARGIGERTSAGGTVSFASDGDIMVNAGAVVDVSGGLINYTPGVMQTSLLMTADGRTFDIGNAPKDLLYQKIVNPTSKVSYDRWGVTRTIDGPSIGHYDPGYTEGRDGGTVSFAAPLMSLNGNFHGSTVTGTLQRDPASAPLGALFRVGDPTGRGLTPADYGAPSIKFVESATPLVVADGAALRGSSTLELPVDFLRDGGFTRTEIYSNGTIEVALPGPLQLRPGSSFSLLGHRVDVRSDVIAPSSTISITSALTAGIPGLTLPDRGINIADGVTLDVRGTWTNDALEVANGVSPDQLVTPVFRDGGKIRLTSDWIDSSLRLGDDVNLLASGGGWMKASGSVVGGRGGEIALLGGMQNASFDIGANTQIEAFGGSGAAGGTFRFEAPRIQIGNGDAWVAPTEKPRPISIAAADPGEPDGDAPPPNTPTAVLGSALFTDFGFANFVINASGTIGTDQDPTALAILPGTALTPRVSTLRFSADARDSRTGGTVEAFSSVYTPLDGSRAPVSVAFSVVEPRRYLSSVSKQLGVLELAEGAHIYTDAGSTVRFSSPGGIRLAGEVVAPSGTISATLGNPTSTDFEAGFVPSLGIDVLASARLDVSGIRQLQPNDAGLLTGSVLSGGTIQLLADRGSVSIRSGSQLLANGATGLLDLPNLVNPSAGYSRTLVGSAGGSIGVRAPESILLAGDLSAHAGVGETAPSPGGSLSVQLTRERGFGGVVTTGGFPTTARVLQLTDGQAIFGDRAPNGFGAVDARKVVAGGFDALTLEGGNRIEIDPTVNLHLARELSIDSREVLVRGDGNAKLSAAYVSFGRTLNSTTAPVSSSGAGTLSISGDLIDITGDTAVSGVSSVLFSSSGDIRLRGVENGGTSVGSLLSTGDITLRATRLYPTTETAFSIKSAGGTSNLVRIEQVGTSPGVPLSVAGSIGITARDIVQAGTLLAPFGQLSLTATDSVTFAPGSVTSVSAGQQTIPFGNISLGNWQYFVGGTALAQNALPSRSIDIDASEIDMQQGSTIDLRGGGDLYAYEWQPGTGGSKDALAPNAGLNLYAVLPSMRGQSGAYDPMEYANAGIGAGDTVYLGGSALLAEGVYPLLPARYALLPGAVLVEVRPDFATMAPNASTTLADGTAVVAGRRTFLNTGIGDSVYSGFAIRDGSYGRQLAAYNDYKASTFFPARADRLDLARAAVPADAAALSLNIGTRLDARGTVQASGATGGVGATLDIAAAKLEIVGSGAAIDPDAVQVQSSAIERWSPSRLLLGGLRSADGSSMEVVSDSVRLDDGVSLVHDEIIVAAKEEIRLGDGSRIASRSTVSSRIADPDFATTLTSLTLTGDGAKGAAVLAASDLSRLQIVRPDAVTSDVPGNIFVESHATLASRSSLLLDTPGRGELDGTLDGAGASWDVVSSLLSFSDTTQETGLTITPTVANALGQGYNARLASTGSIDFLGSVAFGAGVQPGASLTDLTLVASAIRAGGDGTNVSLGASRSLTFQGTAGANGSPAIGSGTLLAKAAEITFGPGNLSMLGFDVSLDAAGDVRAAGKGQLKLDGTLGILAPLLTASTGADLTIDSTKVVSIQSRDGSPAVAVDAPGLGASLLIRAPSIDLSTKILQPSGLVSLNATGPITLGAGALIDVGGTLVDVQGRDTMSPAGTIQLVSGGALVADAAATLNVSAGRSPGGSLIVQSTGLAQLDAALRGGVGASFDLFAGSLTDFVRLNRTLEAGGFTGERDFRVSAGDLSLAAGETITARSVTLTADGGRVNILGSINAKSDNERSSIALFGSQGVTLAAGGALHADGFGDDSRGGIITLGTTTGGTVNVAPGSIVSTLGSAEKGRVQIRAPRIGNDVAIDQLGASFLGVSQISIEPFLSFDNAPATLTQTVFDNFAADVRTFFDNAGAGIWERLGRPLTGTTVVVTPGMEIRRTGDLTVGARDQTLDLMGLRYNDQPLNLTVRATGSITVNGVVSDGFLVDGDTEPDLPPRVNIQAGPSATLRFAAGSTLASANPLAVTPGLAADFKLAAKAIVRTGTGDINIAAARDISYATGASVYTAGNPAKETYNFPTGPSFGFPTDGGQLSMSAGRDVVGAKLMNGSLAGQAVGDWQPRTSGRPESDEEIALPTQWGVDVAKFGFNAGSLGGGDVHVRAGRNVLNLSVSAANSGVVQDNGTVAEYGGGVLGIDAVGDISSLYAHVTHGTNVIRAGGALGRSLATANGDLLGSLFAIQNAAVDIRARSGVALEGAFNPTAISQPGLADNVLQSFFYTYGDKSRLDATSASGDVSLQVDTGPNGHLASFVGRAVSSSVAISILPPTLALRALSGDLNLRSSASIFASDNGQLDLIAARDIVGVGAPLFMSDLAASALPTPLTPSASLSTPTIQGGLNGSGRHLNDPIPVEITAGRDLRNALFTLVKASHVRAGRDIVDSSILGQNLLPTDVTAISAGRDVRYSSGDAGSSREIQLGGPGSLVVVAGRDVDLGFSEGITSIGATLNPSLPTDSGADISVIAGYGPGLRIDRFMTQLVDKSADYEKALVAFIGKFSTGGSTPSYETARSQFLLMDPSTQLAFVSQVFFSELVKSGREVNLDPTLGFDRGYAAIDALFPGSRPGPNDPPSAYEGDILLSFSRIYSLSDGTISLFAPGGLLNVGLANPPKDLQFQRQPSQLGIVAQRAGDVRVFTAGDVLVNASRIFTLGGGSIAVWSTLGDIDAGRGAKSAISAPPPVVTTDPQGNVKVDFGAAVAGSGIRTIVTREEVRPGDVDLIAPAGIVNAGDAGIGAAGNLNVAAQQVVGLDNIQVGGSSTGVPAETSNLGASLSGASNASTSASSSSSDAVEQRSGAAGPAPLADTALGWLEVFVEGFGEEVCKPSDEQCLQRSRKSQ
ncbi:MAG: filamentous hemagglutinin family protein [Gammaproteobacteria bacterium]